jgi:hypothetical protein
MKDLGPLHHFLGMSVTRSADGLQLSQRHYMLEILDRAGMSNCKPCTPPVGTSAKFLQMVAQWLMRLFFMA